MARIIAIIAIVTASLYGMVEVYNVDVYENLHDSIQTWPVEQSFVATCDSIVRLEAFVGKEFGGGFYHLQVVDEANNVIAQVEIEDQGKGWRWIGGEAEQVHPELFIKGKTYTLKFWHSGFSGLSGLSGSSGFSGLSGLSCFSGLI